ncbi:MAG: rRNA maturation RNase YbeY [Lachnospiraceae bacterium]|nr:rRNA maturation RNase YbeY [Lachnospiraceae bacterium]
MITAKVITSVSSKDRFDFSYRRVAGKVIRAVLKAEECPFPCEVSLRIVQSDEIHELNRDFRGIDRETDVLSFPNFDFDEPGEWPEEPDFDVLDPDTGCAALGDIVVNTDRVRSQAAEYGHSELREYAFLIAHSMLHLCGYDHETPEEAGEMEQKQEAVLTSLGICRE